MYMVYISRVSLDAMSSQTIGFREAKDETASKGRKAVERFFSPEFRNRLDARIGFDPLPESVMTLVVDKNMKEMESQLAGASDHVTYVDVGASFQGQPLQRMLLDDNHLSRAGNERLAGALLPAIRGALEL